jgi:hypothetical protein
MSNVSSRIRTVRELINEPRKQSLLLGDARRWNMLCSCLDTIDDTQTAIESYPTSTPSELGTRYLYLYGLLQALYVQQDAVADLATSLQMPYVRDTTLATVREIRNDTAGHPTNRRGRTFHFLSQSTLTSAGFSLMTTYADGRPPSFQHVSVSDLVTPQETSVIAVLDAFSALLREEERKHREEFRSVSLSKCFPPTISYYFEKVYEGIQRDSHRQLGAGMIDLLLEALAKFEEELRRRGIQDAYGELADEIKELRWPLLELRRHLSADPSCTLNERSARIFAFYCREAMKRLEEAAAGLDAKYNETPP